MQIHRTNGNASDRNAGHIVYLNDSQSIAEGLRIGNPKALRALYDRYAGYIHKVLSRIIGSDFASVEDCLQETFTAAFRHGSQLQEPRCLKTWLTRIAIHRATDHLRRRQRERWLQFFAPEAIPDRGACATPLEDNEALQSVYRILKALPPKERIPFVLRRLEQMSLLEIAEVTDSSTATVKRRIHAAQIRFEALAATCPSLENWLTQHGQWRQS